MDQMYFAGMESPCPEELVALTLKVCALFCQTAIALEGFAFFQASTSSLRLKAQEGFFIGSSAVS